MSAINFSLLLILSILWGGSFYFIEKSLVYLSFEQVVFFRVFLAAISIFIVIMVKRIPWNFSIKLWLSFLLMGILNNVIPFLSFTYAQEFISASEASIFNATTPIFVAILAHFFTKDEKLTFVKSFGVSIGFFGIVILVFPQEGFNIQVAVFYAILAPVSYAFAGVFGKLLKGINPIFAVFGMLTCSSIVMYIVFHNSISFKPLLHPYEIKDILMLSVFSTALAYILYFKLLFQVGAVKLLLVTFLIPITASLLGVFLLNEHLTTQMYIGSAFVFVALFLIIKDKK